ncbi:MAG: hypothetical protein K0V04_18290, partial [Deltaproteobacteria bacterium]|nr:hypothetical protein [Deltaproteobacteria bacterium]
TRVEARARDGGRIEVVQSHRGSTQWTTIVGAPSDEAAALAWAGDVLVAHYHPMSSGADLTRLDGDTGKPIWSVPLRARGQVDHSKYRNDVQLRVAAGLVWVYGWESDGAYVETRSLEDGFMDNHLRVERGLPDIDWRAVPETTFDPSIVWPHAVDDCSTGASLEHDGMTYVVQACSISSGARLSARPSRGSEWTWHANLLGIGPISHSAYSNRVALEWKDDHLVVYGDEAMGRYVEVIETRTGATVVNKRWIMP